MTILKARSTIRDIGQKTALKAVNPQELPAYAENFLPSSVTSRPLQGEAPTIDLVPGYKDSNKSPILQLLLSRLDQLIARALNKAH